MITNTFKHLALEELRHITDINELQQRDLTDVFFKELKLSIAHKEIVIIQIHGKPRSGKSTGGLKLGVTILKYMRELKYCKERFGMYHIARNQYEMFKKHQEASRGWTVLVCDELNALEETGINVSIVQANREQFSDVQAARYIHKILISPKDMIDKNADIVLEVIDRDDEQQIIECYLFYNLFYQGQDNQVLLGNVKIYVGDILVEWNKIKDIFRKKKKTQMDLRIIREAAKRDWYVEYMVRKHEKMDLMLKHKVMVERDLDYAEPIVNVIEKLKPIAQMQGKYTHLIRQFLKIQYMRHSLPISLIGETIEEEKIKGVLDLYKSISHTKQDIEYLEKQKQMGKVNPDDYPVKKEFYESNIKEMGDALAEILGFYQNMIRIKKEHNSLLGG